jgi:hypothetical protein
VNVTRLCCHRDGLESSAEFFERDASAERRAAHERNLTTRRVPTSIETSQDFIDAYVVGDAEGWYDYDFDCSELWHDVEVNVAAIDHIGQSNMFGGYQLEALDVPVLLALGRNDYRTPYYSWEQKLHRAPGGFGRTG